MAVENDTDDMEPRGGDSPAASPAPVGVAWFSEAASTAGSTAGGALLGGAAGGVPGAVVGGAVGLFAGLVTATAAQGVKRTRE